MKFRLYPLGNGQLSVPVVSIAVQADYECAGSVVVGNHDEVNRLANVRAPDVTLLRTSLLCLPALENLCYMHLILEREKEMWTLFVCNLTLIEVHLLIRFIRSLYVTFYGCMLIPDCNLFFLYKICLCNDI